MPAGNELDSMSELEPRRALKYHPKSELDIRYEVGPGRTFGWRRREDACLRCGGDGRDDTTAVETQKQNFFGQGTKLQKQRNIPRLWRKTGSVVPVNDGRQKI